MVAIRFGAKATPPVGPAAPSDVTQLRKLEICRTKPPLASVDWTGRQASDHLPSTSIGRTPEKRPVQRRIAAAVKIRQG